MHVICSFLHEGRQYLWSCLHRFIFLLDFQWTERQKYSITEAYSMFEPSDWWCNVDSPHHWMALCLWGDPEAGWGTWPCRASHSPPAHSSPGLSWWGRSPTPAQLCPGPAGCSAQPRSHPESRNHYKSQTEEHLNLEVQNPWNPTEQFIGKDVYKEQLTWGQACICVGERRVPVRSSRTWCGPSHTRSCSPASAPGTNSAAYSNGLWSLCAHQGFYS